MYNGYSAGPEITNNPFLSGQNNAQNRFPDISASPEPPAGQYTNWLQPDGSQSSFQQGIYQQSGFQQPQSPQFNPGYGPQAAAGYYDPNQQLSPQQTTQQFQPTSYFGQQLAATLPMSGSSYGYLQGQNTSQQQTSYNPAQQQLQNNPGYIPQFDPYASIGQGWDGQNQNQNQQQQPSNQQAPNPPTTTTSGTFNGYSHPREYIRTHKQEIESWDTYAWKQLLSSFDALKDAWGARKTELEAKIGQLQMQMQYGGGGYHPAQIQQEAARLQGVSFYLFAS